MTSNSEVNKPAELVPCLIAPTLSHNPILDLSNSSIYSLDMARLKLKINPNELDKFQQILDCWTLPDKVSTYSANKLGGYRNLWVMHFEESSISVGLCHISGSGKTEAGIGFLEYNPNKVGLQGIELVRLLLSCGAEFELIRFDLAIDYPIKRDTVRLLKDGRKYGCELSDAFTEYLGQRNKPGRVKVYDKQAEAGLEIPYTRVELTCDSSWSADKILEQLPTVFGYDNNAFDDLKRTTKAFAISVQAHLARGDTLEPWLSLCDAKTKTKLRKAFGSQRALIYNKSCVQAIIDQAKSVASGTWKEQISE